MRVEHITTELGNEILDSLKADGWRVASEYSPLAFDKGIDFDRYTLQKNGMVIEMEWDNWFEWKISGPVDTIESLLKKL